MKSVLILFAAALLLISIACSQKPKLDEPPEIQLGADACNECYMLISEEKYASAYVTPDGQFRVFDDIGCMLKHVQKTNETPLHMWVHDFINLRWLETDSAVFVKSQNLETPMGYGIIAVGKAEKADSLSSVREGEVLRFTQLQNLLLGTTP
ncbi:MAG: nitrous oxide reductase accessory protein NosL [candidate division KSB1 bacterium]|nr:nitrous oxide reductase accessory protein NosL [candidate division KSB1 bacterium]